MILILGCALIVRRLYGQSVKDLGLMAHFASQWFNDRNSVIRLGSSLARLAGFPVTWITLRTRVPSLGQSNARSDSAIICWM